MQKIKKIIISRAAPFNKGDFKRLGIELLAKNGFEVEVWDLTNILYPDVIKRHIPPDPVNWPGCKKFIDKKVLLNSLKGLKSDTFFMAQLPYSRKTYPIYKTISDSAARYGSSIGNICPYDVRSSNWDKLRKIPYEFKKSPKTFGKKLPNFIFSIIPFRYLGIKPARLIFVGGSRLINHSSIPVDSSTEIVWAHSFNYDLYLEERNKPSIERPMAVFLDQDIPFHSDGFYMELGTLFPNEYYPLLNKFFRLVEDELGLEVVVAAHPRSHYESQPEYFEGRTCLRGETVRLVKESRLVLAHSSLATDFAALFYKPIMFLTSDKIDKGFHGHYIRKVAEFYKKEPIFMDRVNNINWETELTIERPVYDSHVETYIKNKNTEELPFWQIAANRLKRGI